MKKHFKQLLILIPFLFIAGAAFAAYSFVGPTTAPTGNNTTGPLDDSSADQIKNGGLSVNAFNVTGDAYFDQNAIFTGIVQGGTPTATAPVEFGGPSNKVGVTIIGSQSITGTYQSDLLKTGGGEKPLCADADGTFYICGATPAAAASAAPSVSLAYNETTFIAVGNAAAGDTNNVAVTLYAVKAVASPYLTVPVEVYVSERGTPITFLDRIKDSLTADASVGAIGVCHPPATDTALGTLQINAYSTTSSGTLSIPQGCTPSDLGLFIDHITPTADNGQTIKY